MNKLAKSSELSILFLSCDKYHDLWKPLFYCVNKYFKQDVYPVYLGSNTVAYKNKGLTTLFSGPDKDWSTSLLKILDQIKTPYIFLWLDDFFPISAINIARFSNVLHFMIKQKAKHIHVIPQPKPDQVITDGLYGMYEKKAPYRVTAFGFWEVEALKKLLLPGESPWNFEIMGSYRSSYMEGFYCAMKPVVVTINVVEKGKFFKDAYSYCKKQGIPLDVSKREVFAGTNYMKSELQKFIFDTIVNVPWKFRVAVMNVLRRIMISY